MRRRKTYRTKCRECGAEVFFHTNGYGDSVLLDDLCGPPWPVHGCWLDYMALPENTDSPVTGEANSRFGLIGFAGRMNITDENRARYENESGRYEARMPIPTDKNMTRMNPENFEGIDLGLVKGWIQACVSSPKKPDRFASGIGMQLWDEVVGNRLHQMTMVDFGFNSFTFRCEPRHSAGITQGDVVAVQLRVTEVIGFGHLFLCERLEKLISDQD